jgi:hypothetical protein
MDQPSRSEIGKLPFKAAAQSNIEPTCSYEITGATDRISRMGVLQQPLAKARESTTKSRQGSAKHLSLQSLLIHTHKPLILRQL